MATHTPAPAAPATPATPPPSLNLFMVVGGGLGIAIILAFAFRIPVLVTLLVMGMVKWAGVKNSWTAAKIAIRTAIGMVIFITLRFLAAKLLGIYPADTFDTIDNSGGFSWILVGHDISTYVLWEMTFALVAGQVVIDWIDRTNKKVAKAFIVIGFLILSLVIGIPKYANSWPDRDTVGSTLVEKGVLGALWSGGRVFLVGKPAPAPPPPPRPAESYSAPATLGQFPDRVTPCEIYVGKELRDLYTDGDPVYVLPPNEPRSNAVLYSGHGHLVLKLPNGKGIGKWGFWSANTAKPEVLIRGFGK